MRTVRRDLVLFFVLLTALLFGACGDKDAESQAVSISPPPAPVAAPAGPDLTLAPGAPQTFHASSPGADSYRWALEGDGKISSEEGEMIIFTAPQQDAGTSILKVKALNKGGESPTTSLEIKTAAAPAVRVDSVGIPAGWMTSSGGDPRPYIKLPSEPGACRTGAECIKVVYNPGGVWGGIWWWPPACGPSGSPDAWPRFTRGTCAINLQAAGPLSSVRKLTLWARGAKGGEVVEFKVGATDTLPKPGRSTGKVTLSTEWKQYEINLEGLDTTRVAGLFAWIAADLDNPQGAVFYLDDMQFEGSR
jgi:hypothetical protein